MISYMSLMLYKNLLNVSKPDANNNVIIEFDENYCFMKHMLT